MEVACGRCGAPAAGEGGEAPAGWSLGTDGRGRAEWLCPACAREHIRSIEAKLPGEYW